LNGLAHEQLQAVNALSSIMAEFKDLARQFSLALRSGSQLVNFAKRFMKKLQAMREGECMLIPGLFNGATLVYIVEKESGTRYVQPSA
jgi:hypothetical protein